MILLALISITGALGIFVLFASGCLKSEQSRALRIAFYATLSCGFVMAYWCIFKVEYQWSATLKVVGAPIPVALFQLENGHWVDFVGGPGFLLDLVIVPAVFALPVSIALVVRRWRRSRLGDTHGFDILPSR